MNISKFLLLMVVCLHNVFAVESPLLEISPKSEGQVSLAVESPLLLETKDSDCSAKNGDRQVSFADTLGRKESNNSQNTSDIFTSAVPFTVLNPIAAANPIPNLSASLLSSSINPFQSADARRNLLSCRRTSLAVGSLGQTSIPRGLAHKPLTVRILSMDGGGVKGIGLAYFLSELEGRFNTPIQSLFHYVAGTSIGGILAICMSLSDPKTPSQPLFTAKKLLEMMKGEAKNIFQRRWRSYFGITGPKYRSPLKEFQRIVGKDARFEGGSIRSMVPVYDCELQSLKLVTNYDSIECRMEKRPHEVFTAADVAAGTSAAPTYMPLHQCSPVQNKRRDNYLFADGGIGANNPSWLVLNEVMRTYPGAEIVMVSIGTGSKTKIIRQKDVMHAGTIKWIEMGLISMLMDAPNSLIVSEIESMFTPVKEAESPKRAMVEGCFCRFDPNIEDDSMDNTKESNLRKLTISMEREISRVGSPWQSLVNAFEERPFQPLPEKRTT